MSEFYDDDDNDKLDHYIAIGAVDIVGIDESGEFIMQITEKSKEVAPELWESHERHINDSLMVLYEMGLMSVSYNEDLQAVFELTEEGKKKAKEFGIMQMDLDGIEDN